MKSEFENIIFDFGGVIINIDYEATINAFKDLGISDFDALYSQAAQSDLFDAIETGRISPQHFINGILQLLPAGVTPNQVVHAWNAMILDIPKERIEFLQQLSQTHDIYLLSNTNSIHIDKAMREWNNKTQADINDVFKKVYLSHEMGMRKPDVEIFRHVCQEQGLDPSKTLFIDDSIQHIHGAREAGLHAHHLLSNETIQSILS
ncbi:MAG: haloacid dehalogenase [Fluviicola sp. XM-24bin1]|nr:MAG: haloacid dehalogenase [Fluviicola sp. XM-24bin1]